MFYRFPKSKKGVDGYLISAAPYSVENLNQLDNANATINQQEY